MSRYISMHKLTVKGNKAEEIMGEANIFHNIKPKTLTLTLYVTNQTFSGLTHMVKGATGQSGLLVYLINITNKLPSLHLCSIEYIINSNH